MTYLHYPQDSETLEKVRDDTDKETVCVSRQIRHITVSLKHQTTKDKITLQTLTSRQNRLFQAVTCMQEELDYREDPEGYTAAMEELGYRLLHLSDNTEQVIFVKKEV